MGDEGVPDGVMTLVAAYSDGVDLRRIASKSLVNREMPVLNDILDWSAERPNWQRDALRRLVVDGGLDEKDDDELCRICLEARGIVDPTNPAPTATPLSAEHLPTEEGAIDRVRVLGIRAVSGVNALAPGQTLTFERNGLSIVFGYNGSGKTGYARILGAMCHARHRGGRILQNAFAGDNQPTPTATVDLEIGEAERSEIWREGEPTASELRRVSFFDSDCASVHVDDANELAFTPFGLDVLPALAARCRTISSKIQELVEHTERARPTSLANPGAADGTSVRKALDELNQHADINKFREMAVLSPADLQRIQELREATGTDPAARARELRRAISRLQRLLDSISLVLIALSAEAVKRIRSKLADLTTKTAAAAAAALEAFGEQALVGVGENVWLELWAAARKFSQQQAYPEAKFPNVDADALCVLCQQSLSPEASNRLTAFEEFIQAETQKVAEAAERDLRQARVEIEALLLGTRAFEAALLDIPHDLMELRHSIRRFFRVAWKLRQAIVTSCNSREWTARSTLPTTPAPELTMVIQTMSRKAGELERAANADERKALVAELNELLAREWLGGVLDDVEVEIANKKKVAALKRADDDTVTTGITRKSGELGDTYVTVALRNRLAEEISRLGADGLRVELDLPGGRLGQPRFKISLRGMADDIKVRQILSEGEFRCIALAGFLAELSTEDSGSALIFDDPVSSLDHKWRRKVAERLVDLSRERQVVVFTHDIVFLADLDGSCDATGVPKRQSYLQCGRDLPGEILDGLPWAAMKVRDRIARLNAWSQNARVLHRARGAAEYDPEARRIYGLLRETWERAVEEVLLNGVVLRFDRAIHTQQLIKVADITPEDIQQIEAGMTKCSRFLVGHDEAQAIADPVPAPDELAQDISGLESWARRIRGRRN